MYSPLANAQRKNTFFDSIIVFCMYDKIFIALSVNVPMYWCILIFFIPVFCCNIYKFSDFITILDQTMVLPNTF